MFLFLINLFVDPGREDQIMSWRCQAFLMPTPLESGLWAKVTARRIELPSKKMPCHLVSKYPVTPHPARSGMSHGPRRRG